MTMKKVSYAMIMISIISFLFLSVEIIGDFEPIKIKLYGCVHLLALIIGLVLNFIAKCKQ